FIRFRNTLRGDIDRIDNVKRLAFAMLQRLKELSVRAVTVVPNLVETFLSDVETNASPALVRQLASRVPNPRLVATATVPVHEVEGKGYVRYDPAEVQAFIAQTFGGVARDFSAPPEQGLLVTDRSGVPGLGQAYVDALVAAGVPAELVTLREDGGSEPGPTRLLATLDAWSDADYYAELLHASKQQVDRMAPYGGRAVKLELVLGSDAAERIDHDRALMASVATTVAAGAEERSAQLRRASRRRRRPLRRASRRRYRRSSTRSTTSAPSTSPCSTCARPPTRSTGSSSPRASPRCSSRRWRTASASV